MGDAKLKPHSDEARWVCIYPLFINSKKTVPQGRRVVKEKAIDNPTLQEIFDVLNHAGLSCKLEKNKMHPRDPNRDANLQGRVRVQLRNDDGSLANEKFPTRKSLMLYACETIPKLKARAPSSGVSSGASNAQPAASKGKKGNKKRR